MLSALESHCMAGTHHKLFFIILHLLQHSQCRQPELLRIKEEGAGFDDIGGCDPLHRGPFNPRGER